MGMKKKLLTRSPAEVGRGEGFVSILKLGNQGNDGNEGRVSR